MSSSDPTPRPALSGWPANVVSRCGAAARLLRCERRRAADRGWRHPGNRADRGHGAAAAGSADPGAWRQRLLSRLRSCRRESRPGDNAPGAGTFGLGLRDPPGDSPSVRPGVERVSVLGQLAVTFGDLRAVSSPWSVRIVLVSWAATKSRIVRPRRCGANSLASQLSTEPRIRSSRRHTSSGCSTVHWVFDTVGSARQSEA
jgi:hypothetical protein